MGGGSLEGSGGGTRVMMNLSAAVPQDDTVFVRDETSLLPQLHVGAPFFDRYDDHQYASRLEHQRVVHRGLLDAGP